MISEADAVRAAVAAQVAYDAATKIVCFVGNDERTCMYYPTLTKALKECADALGYKLVRHA